MPKKYLFRFITIIVIALFFNCKSKKMNLKGIPIEQNLKKVSKEILSPDKSKKLILSYMEDLNARKEFNYIVLNSKTKKELIRGSFIGLKMEWNNNKSIKGYLFQGIVRENYSVDDSNTYKIIQIK